MIAELLIGNEDQGDQVVYIDTNGSFKSIRLLQMLKSRGVQDKNAAENMLKRVLIARVYDEKDLRIALTKIQVTKTTK
ncbi:unnamed protein product [Gongylonema pulchrum]|uniref:RecA family profile 1 domain-containing protein n=1 Tax=Gongylonema pulchrum TaxID=637853 RepID=A0A3P6SXP8_9BILA|nr:unnamed protein product [Gongylonema pulchrum]